MKVKNVLKILLICLLINSMLGLTAFADEMDWNKQPCVSPDSVLLPPGQTKSESWHHPKEKGNFAASAHLSISNEGKGVIGVFAQMLTYYPIDKCRMRIYLDRWYEEQQDWVMQDYWDITLSQENQESGELTTPTISFDIKNQPTGYYYRLRGMHVAWLNGVSEGFTTQTDGILITE